MWVNTTYNDKTIKNKNGEIQLIKILKKKKKREKQLKETKTTPKNITKNNNNQTKTTPPPPPRGEKGGGGGGEEGLAGKERPPPPQKKKKALWELTWVAACLTFHRAGIWKQKVSLIGVAVSRIGFTGEASLLDTGAAVDAAFLFGWAELSRVIACRVRGKACLRAQDGCYTDSNT